jgi:rod shape-determining protein MreB
VLVGGGALLRDFDHLLRAETKLPIVRGEDPFTAVTLGAGHTLDSIDLLSQVAMP